MADSTAVASSPRTGPVRRRAAASGQQNRPNSSRAAGAGGSSSTMMKLYSNDDSNGLRVDPVIVLVLSLAFIASVFALHIIGKLTRNFGAASEK